MRSTSRSTLAACVLVLLVLAPPVVSGELRFVDDIKSFEKQDRSSPPPEGGTVFVGSSTFTLWGKDLEKTFAKYKAINRGFGGSTLPDINNYVDRIVSKYKPKRVVLYAGTNDIAELKHTGEQVCDDLKTFVARARAKQPQLDIYFVSMSMAPSRVQWEDRYNKGNALVRAYCSQDKHLHYIDIVPVMRDKQGQLRKEFFGMDQLHMNPEGYKVWVPVLEKALANQ